MHLLHGKEEKTTYRNKDKSKFCLLFFVLVPFLMGREERQGHHVAEEERVRGQSESPGQTLCLSGNLAHCCQKAIFLHINAFAQHCCNSSPIHAALWHELLSPFLRLPTSPLEPIYQTWHQRPRNLKSWWHGLSAQSLSTFPLKTLCIQ